MDRGDLILLKGLLRHQRLLALAVIADGRPVAGVVPFVASPDFGALAVHVSALTRHAQGLGGGAPWSGVVHVPDSSAVDPLQVARVYLEGASRRLEDEAVLEAVRAKWIERFPSAEMTVDLGDFAFFSLDVEAGRLVAGLGQARNLSREHFEQAARL